VAHRDLNLELPSPVNLQVLEATCYPKVIKVGG
jgi:hypothetical protein